MDLADLKALQSRATAFAQTPRGRVLLKVVRWAFLAGVLGWLGVQLAQIGWRDVLTSLPTTPWFYVLFLVIYFQLPFIEGLIYRQIWDIPWKRVVPVLIRKRVLNVDVLNYSGEVYLYLQAQKLSPKPNAFLLGSLKDNAIASAVASLSSLLLMAGFFIATGQLALESLLGQDEIGYLAIGVVVFVMLVGVALRFRNTVFTMTVPTVAGVFGAHLFRFCMVFVWQVLQWAVVVPEASMEVWATMLVIVAFTNRVPFVPAKDLAGAALVLGVSGVYDAYLPAIAGMLMVRIVLDKAMNFVLFAGTSWLGREEEDADEGLQAAETGPTAASAVSTKAS